MSSHFLESVSPGLLLVVGGDRVVEVSAAVAAQFQRGDSLYAVEQTGEVLLVPARERAAACSAIERALAAFRQMAQVSDDQIAQFYESFAARLEDDAVWDKIRKVNAEDVARARERGRSTTRLVADDKMRRNMIAGLRGWIHTTSQRGRVIERIQHEGWVAELVGAELGVVGFVFEGRPNVVADATGVLRGGNTVVFRIGRDALGTAKAILSEAASPALREAGLPEGAVGLVDSESHAAGWALFADGRLSLAVARGSGHAVDTLGSLARSAGVPASLHGTGGAWIVAAESTTPGDVENAVYDSLDRKVCNTLNTLCLPSARVTELLPAVLAALTRAAERRGHAFKLHVVESSVQHVPSELFSKHVSVRRSQGDVTEPQAEPLPEAELGREWEWEDSPEITLHVVERVEQAVQLFNQYSPQFVACLLSKDAEEHERFYRTVNAPFVGDGFTRWVDGQYALGRPELGLSNWQHGRLFGRGGVLSGDSVFTVRTRVFRQP